MTTGAHFPVHWINGRRVGRMVTRSARVGPASGIPGRPATPLEQLHGTVRRYDNPTDAAWPSNDEI
jgi:hypothetical protein